LITPLDKQTFIESAKKTSRAIVIDEGYEAYGVTAELASVIADGAFYYLDAPVKRMGAMDQCRQRTRYLKWQRLFAGGTNGYKNIWNHGSRLGGAYQF